LRLVYRLIREVLPQVEEQLEKWKLKCREAGDDCLAKQASDSLRLKRFHAQGGSVFSLYPDTAQSEILPFIVAFQTISDYLDNLCDRAGVQDETAFRQLHLSMLDAVEPGSPFQDYYSYYPYHQDGGYLKALVDECRYRILQLPSHGLVLPYVKNYVSLYSEMQVYKHLHQSIREERLIYWAEGYLPEFPDITCWEFGAAAGSTLGIFVMVAAAANPSLSAEEVSRLDQAYFPWICGLHILLDYHIDAEEDRETGDLNFTSYYPDSSECLNRVKLFLQHSLEACPELPYPRFHTTVIKGLLAMYLSDPKAMSAVHFPGNRKLIRKAGMDTLLYHSLCLQLRKRGKI
jgi:tetraprenyl-beta-curcumene synthase